MIRSPKTPICDLQKRAITGPCAKPSPMRFFVISCNKRVVHQNQHCNECASACPKNCHNFKNPPEASIAMCVPRCDYDKGFIFVGGKSGQCLLLHMCL
ncbi:hypothetical protein AVEN_132294-1 [Araneus ventricosus]|uniref:TIL domain-containing protein n=1 Tax=Araneus ventricosus TaxID=182803 RepID=A0A4Y2U0P0_ARAVE|nr:hypothetical protein AVEN_115817-1 [Araneus ventricosus]GBO06458.1 hypothetical protein AVEN_132294-1 [Araneus ventricosus]